MAEWNQPVHVSVAIREVMASLGIPFPAAERAVAQIPEPTARVFAPPRCHQCGYHDPSSPRADICPNCDERWYVAA